MHTKFDYDKISDPEKRKAKALADVRDWIGKKKYATVMRDVKRCNPAMTYSQFQLMCSFAGIEGYPVKVWAEECGLVPEQDKAQVR